MNEVLCLQHSSALVWKAYYVLFSLLHCRGGIGSLRGLSSGQNSFRRLDVRLHRRGRVCGDSVVFSGAD